MGKNRGTDFDAEHAAQASQHEANLRAHSDSLRGAASGTPPGTKPMPKTPGDPLDMNDNAFSSGSGGAGPGGGRIPPNTAGQKMTGTPGLSGATKGGGPLPPNTTGQKLRGSRG